MKVLLSNLRYDSKRRIQPSAFIWFLLAIIAVLVELHRGSINNYLIFKGVFWHTINQSNLYIYYPGEYLDLNHYGPVFSLFIFPFAILPNWLGVILWAVLNAWILFYAINQLPVSPSSKNIILLLSSIEMMTSIHNVQFNPMLTGWLILTFVCINKDKTALACFFIVAGFLIKIYGLAGILFFFFSKEKLKFVTCLLFWLILLFLLPMTISSPSFIIQSYLDWFHALVDKNAVNIRLDSYGIDLSVMGMIRRVLKIDTLTNASILIPAIIAISIPLLKIRLYDDINFRLSYLALILISVVIFSSSAESPTFVIAVTGVAIWYAINYTEKRGLEMVLLVFVMCITCLSNTDLFPKYIYNHVIKPFSLKALPCFIIWIVLLVNLLVARPVSTSSTQLT
jgi:Glycosyltransferase family 87